MVLGYKSGAKNGGKDGAAQLLDAVKARLNTIWRGVGDPVPPVVTNTPPVNNVRPGYTVDPAGVATPNTSSGKELVPWTQGPTVTPVTPSIVKPGLLGRTKDILWDNRNNWQRAGIVLAGAPLVPQIPGAVTSLAKGYAGLFTGGNGNDDAGFDLSAIKTPEQQYMENQKGLYDLFDAYENQPQNPELLRLASDLTSGMKSGGGYGGNVKSGFTKQQLAAQEAASATDGSAISMSTPVYGDTAAAIDRFDPSSAYAQSQMNNLQAQARAAGVKVTNDMKLKFLDSLRADYISKQTAVQQARINQQLQDAQAISAIRQKGIVLPDMSVLRNLASKYNNFSFRDKEFLKGQNIFNVNDYVNNEIKRLQG